MDMGGLCRHMERHEPGVISDVLVQDTYIDIYYAYFIKPQEIGALKLEFDREYGPRVRLSMTLSSCFRIVHHHSADCTYLLMQDDMVASLHQAYLSLLQKRPCQCPDPASCMVLTFILCPCLQIYDVGQVSDFSVKYHRCHAPLLLIIVLMSEVLHIIQCLLHTLPVAPSHMSQDMLLTHVISPRWQR